ncbi:hypothetical protein [Ancylobacter polymorphus]|uniref:Uncharacterized protein n=1 Tax=Ancylobacter polymorphus TaxID=223390 RepID=A0A9E6ZZK0_9HYPH|nr:hypothetical protein [Ancylobacter polymorphus]UOK70210.1 hypothetical protein K9D25_15935 [Ancylobacter polymorphus]
MQPYEIVRKKLIKTDGEWRIAPEPPPADARTWIGNLAFVPGAATEVRKKVDAIKISFAADVLPAEGGAWVWAGISDLEKIVRALRTEG